MLPIEDWTLPSVVFAFVVLTAGVLTVRSYLAKRKPSFVSAYGTRVWHGGFAVPKSDFERIQDVILDVYPSVRPTWTREAILACFATLKVRFVPMPIRTRSGIASGITDPDTGDTCTICHAVPIYNSAFAHEFIHVLCIQVDHVSYEDDVSHRHWARYGFYVAIEEVRKRARAS